MLEVDILVAMEKKPIIRRLDGPVRRVVIRTPEVDASSTSSMPSLAEVEPIIYTQVATASPVVAKLSRPWWKLGFGLSRRQSMAFASLLFVFLVAGVGVKAVLASQRIVTKNTARVAPALQGEVDPTKLRGEGDGRINILLLGVGGSHHDGGTLSDTIMVASVDPINKTVALLSIPRDLYVKIPGYGNGKINGANSQGGPELAKTVVDNILDLPIHYYVQVDFSGFKQAVDSVGGVDVNNLEALTDPSYPCDDGAHYCPFNLLPGQYHMNGTLALKFARCRHGSCGDDFGRAARQQVLLSALRQKALQASTLTNPIKLNGLLDTIGNHVRTDLQPNELEKLSRIVKDIDTTKTVSKVLDDTPTGLLVNGGSRFAGAGAILLPRAGDFDYTEIRALVHSVFVDGYIKREKATIEVDNGTSRNGLAATVKTQLLTYNYNVIAANTASIPQSNTTIVDYSGGKKPYTVKYLEDRFHAKAVRQTRPPATPEKPTGADIVITVGADYSLTPASPSSTTKQ